MTRSTARRVRSAALAGIATAVEHALFALAPNTLFVDADSVRTQVAASVDASRRHGIPVSSVSAWAATVQTFSEVLMDSSSWDDCKTRLAVSDSVKKFGNTIGIQNNDSSADNSASKVSGGTYGAAGGSRQPARVRLIAEQVALPAVAGTVDIMDILPRELLPLVRDASQVLRPDAHCVKPRQRAVYFTGPGKLPSW